MKRLVYILIFLSFFAEARDADQKAGEELCGMHAKFDRVVMGARQDGVSLSENISLVPSDDKEVAEMMREIILNAYESPRYRTDENIQRAIQDFENEVYLDCYRTFVAGPDGGR